MGAPYIKADGMNFPPRLRDLIDVDTASIADGEVPTYDSATETFTGETPAGGATWDATKTVAIDVVVGTTDTEIPEFTVNPLAYGLYEYECYILVVGGVAGCSNFVVHCPGNSPGEAYPSFSGDLLCVGQGDEGNIASNSGANSGGQMMYGTTISMNAGFAYYIYVKGIMAHHQFASYYADNFILYGDTTVGDCTIKAGSYFKYRLLKAEDASL